MKKQHQSQEEFEKIERYLDGSMEREERAGFEESLNSDPGLKTRVEEIRLLQMAVEEQSLRNKLDEYHREMASAQTQNKPAAHKSGRILTLRILAVAASLALLIGFGYWWYYGQKTAGEKLFDKYFQPDPGLLTPMSATSDYAFYRGMVDYKQGNYEEAINRWKPLAEKNPENDTLNFYLGVSYLAGDKPDKAIEYLSKAVRVPQSRFINEARYYLGLARLKAGNTEEAVRALKKSNLKKSRLILKEIAPTD